MITTRKRSFDFLRGIAILGVITVHTSQSFPSGVSEIDFVAGLGRFGVQLFFYVSALTMCHMWMAREGESNPIRKFYVRRLFRIAPLFWIAIPVYLFINGNDKSYWAPEGVGSTQIILTIMFLHGFWPSSINSVVPGGWSVAVEMTFYALFPLLIRTVKNREKLYLILGIFIWIANILIFRELLTDILTTQYNTNSATIVKDMKLNFLSQFPIFFFGCYLHFKTNRNLDKYELTLLIGWLMGATLFWVLYKFQDFGFLVVCLVIGVFVRVSVAKNVRCAIIEKLGVNSYAIYLVHFSILHYLKIIIEFWTSSINLFVGMILTTVLSFLLARVINLMIETKVQGFVKHITK